MSDTITAYRFFDIKGGNIISCQSWHSPNKAFVWPPPNNGKPGEWVKHDGEILLHETRMYASPTIAHALKCRQALELGRVEIRNIVGRNEFVLYPKEIRIVRMFPRVYLIAIAVLAAKSVLKIHETKYPDDERPRRAINETIEKLVGKCDPEAAHIAGNAVWYAADAYSNNAYAASCASNSAVYPYGDHSVSANVFVDSRKEWLTKFNADAELLLSIPESGLMSYIRAIPA